MIKSELRRASRKLKAIPSTRRMNQEKHPLKQSSNLLETYLTSPLFSDVEIICEGEKLPAHKMVLAHCSPVFRNIFENEAAQSNSMSETKETISNEVKMDENAFAIKQMLKWMYAGNVTDSNEMDLRDQIDLYNLAHRYQVLGLRHLCSRVILTRIDVNNALEIYLLGKVYDDNPLAEKAYNMVMKNRNQVFADQVACAEYFQKYPEFLQPFLLSNQSNQ